MSDQSQIIIACDHGGFDLKQIILTHLKDAQVSFVDKGCFDLSSVNYPDFAALVAKEVSEGLASKGILICGTGIGMAITANKFPGVRACVVHDVYSAKMTREHNDLNVLCLGGRVIGPGLATEIVDVFLKTPFAGGRHLKRLELIQKIEKQLK